MTTQEAIQTIQKMLEVYTSECRTLMNYQITALEMAIEALTHFNSTSNSIKTELSCLEKPNRSDLIRRSDAILAVQWSHTPDSAISAIKSLPSASKLEAKWLQDVEVERDYWKQRAKNAERKENERKKSGLFG